MVENSFLSYGYSLFFSKARLIAISSNQHCDTPTSFKKKTQKIGESILSFLTLQNVFFSNSYGYGMVAYWSAALLANKL